MASTHILAVGKISHGNVQIRMSKHVEIERLLDTISDDDWARLALSEIEGYEALPPLQDFIDYAAELEDLIEAREDEEFWRSGQW